MITGGFFFEVKTMGHGRHVSVTSNEIIPDPYAEPPIGAILLFYGSIPAIPAGYNLCNGFNGTPDLRNKFIVGAGDIYDPADEGGNTTHTHELLSGNHLHTIQAGFVIKSGTAYRSETNGNALLGNTNAANNLPPYKAVYFIKRAA